MAETNSTAHTLYASDWLEACDTLSHAAAVAEFVQGITLYPARDEGLHLQPGELTGLFYVMQGLRDQIEQARVLLNKKSGAAI